MRFVRIFIRNLRPIKEESGYVEKRLFKGAEVVFTGQEKGTAV